MVHMHEYKNAQELLSPLKKVKAFIIYQQNLLRGEFQEKQRNLIK